MTPICPAPPEAATIAAARPPVAWRSVALITIAAVAIYTLMRWGGGQLQPLSHNDFRTSSEFAPVFCDPGAPSFIPIASVHGALDARLETRRPARAGEEVEAVLELRTASGRPILPEHILVSHTRKVHLLIIDPSLDDYQHVHPEPVAGAEARYGFRFTPALAGRYRLFIDFTPVATGRGLYGLVELEVAPPEGPTTPAGHSLPPWVKSGLVFQHGRLVAGQREDFTLRIWSTDPEKPLRLASVMGAYAHLVAFDRERSGLAHIHPFDSPERDPSDGRQAELRFNVEIPARGDYRFFAQLEIDGREVFARFDVRVE